LRNDKGNAAPPTYNNDDVPKVGSVRRLAVRPLSESALGNALNGGPRPNDTTGAGTAPQGGVDVMKWRESHPLKCILM
jgi:hypothetical protein